MTAEELEASLKDNPLTDDEMQALMEDAATLELLEHLDEAAFDRVMEQTACLCAGRFVCTRCKVLERLS